MALAQTKAAGILQASSDELTSHQVISLLMEGALERAAQAKNCLAEGNRGDADILVAKLVGIINGLRGSLNLEAGGDIAVNLDALYDYMVSRLGDPKDDETGALAEVEKLIGELKSGWDGIDEAVDAATA